MTDHDFELDAIVSMLEDAGLIKRYTQKGGMAELRLTERGSLQLLTGGSG